MDKYLIAEVTVNKLDGAKVKYLSNRPGIVATSDLNSEFLKKFDTIEEAQKEIKYANQCVVKASWF